MVIMNDIEWPMFSYYVIYYEKIDVVMVNTTLLTPYKHK